MQPGLPDCTPTTTSTTTTSTTTTTTTSTTTTSTTTIPACTFLLKWGVPGTGNGQFSGASRVATDGSGNVYVVDSGNHRIQNFDASGNFLPTWASNGSGNGQFAPPFGVATDGSGNVYVTDGNQRIQKFDASGTFLTTWGSFGSGNGQFNTPEGVATDASGNVYVADRGDARFQGNNRIEKFDASGTFLSTWGSLGSGDGQFSFPEGVATDGSGYVYVADPFNTRIQRVDAM